MKTGILPQGNKLYFSWKLHFKTSTEMGISAQSLHLIMLLLCGQSEVCNEIKAERKGM